MIIVRIDCVDLLRLPFVGAVCEFVDRAHFDQS